MHKIATLFGKQTKSLIGFNSNINTNTIISRAGMVSAIILFLFFSYLSFPIVLGLNNVDGAAQTSVTTLTMNTDHENASLSLLTASTNGTFASGSVDESAQFTVQTNNATGYTLTIKGTDDTGNLVNSDAGAALESIATTSGIDETTFNTTAYNGKWGFKPSKINSVANTTKFYQAPTATEPTVLDVTSNANNTANSYTIGLGARADYTSPAGAYSNTFVLTAVGNPISYSIHYLDGTGDTSVSNMPSTQSSTIDSTSAIISPNKTPERTGYTFSKWCLGSVNTSDVSSTDHTTGTVCNGTEYANGSSISFIDQTSTTNSVNLHALWVPKTYDVTIRTSTGISSVTLNGTNCTSSTGCTVSNLVYKNSYSLAASTNSGYSFSGWTSSTGIGSIANSGSSNTTYTVGDGTTTLTASAANGTYTIDLNNYNATSSGSTSATVTYNSSSLTSITYPSRQYSVSGFSTSYNNASGATVSSTSTKYYTYSFNGWYTSSSSGSRVIGTNGALVSSVSGYTDSSSRWIRESGTTLYAQWSSGTSITLPTISKSNYTCGWATSTNTTSITYASGYSGLAPTSNLTLYGVCNPITRSLKINFSGSGVSSVQVRTSSGTGGTLMGTVTSSGSSISGLAQGTSYYLYPVFSSGYEFSSWAKNDSYGTLSSTSSSNPYYTIGSGNGSVTISTSAVPTTTYMQSYSKSTCQSEASSSAVTVVDQRDNKEYTVRYINGNCWMTKNLAFVGMSSDSAGTMTLNPATTNVSTTKTVTYYDYTTASGSVCYSGENQGYVNSCLTASTDTSNADAYGVYYNYAAATASNITGYYSNSTNNPANHDICPAGWRLPTQAEMETVVDYSSAFSPVLQGVYDRWKILNPGVIGAWWSATARSDQNRYDLHYSTSGTLDAYSYRGRYFGNAVRCIRKS